MCTHGTNASLGCLSVKNCAPKVFESVKKDGISKMDIHSSMSANEELDIEQTHSFGACKCSAQFIWCIWDLSSTHMHQKSTFVEKAVLDFKMKRRRWYSPLPSWDGGQPFAAFEAHNRRACTQTVIQLSVVRGIEPLKALRLRPPSDKINNLHQQHSTSVECYWYGNSQTR